MYTLGERIRHIRENILRLNQSCFANKLGFSRVATISDYETNKRLPDIITLRKIASVGGVSLEWLLTGACHASINVAHGGMSPPACTVNFAEVKVYGRDCRHGAAPIDCLLIPKKDFESAPFAVRVEDNSMSPTILEGATIGVDRGDRRPVSGGLFAVRLGREGLTVRRVFVRKDKIVLRPDNPAFPETTITSTELTDRLIVGRVAWLYQKF